MVFGLSLALGWEADRAGGGGGGGISALQLPLGRRGGKVKWYSLSAAPIPTRDEDSGTYPFTFQKTG